MSDILISIRPRHVAKILDGSKTFELRRRFNSKHEGAWLWIYETSPTCSVVAVAYVAALINTPPNSVWRSWSRFGFGVTREEYDEYFAGCKTAWAIGVTAVKKLTTPITLAEMRAAGIQPPQSYRTVPAEIAAQWEAKR